MANYETNTENSFDPKREQAILAFFKDPDVAQQAQKELENAGITTAQIDPVSVYPGEPTQEYMNPITGNIPSLGDFTLGTTFAGRDASVLAAADPSASGLSADEIVSGENILLTVVCPKEKVEQAVQIIRFNGGNT